MDASAIIISAIQIVTSIGAVILFILGIFLSLRYINIAKPDAPEEEIDTFNSAVKKSIIFIAIGLLLYFIARFCVNLVPLAEQNYGIMAIAAQALLDTVKNSGYLILLPVLLKLWRRNVQRKSIDSSK